MYLASIREIFVQIRSEESWSMPGHAPLCTTLLILCEQRISELPQSGPTFHFERVPEISSYYSGDWNTPKNIEVYPRFSVLHCVYLCFDNGAVVQPSIGLSDNDQLHLMEPTENIPLPCIRRKWHSPKFPRKTTPCRLQTFQCTCWARPFYTCQDSKCLSCPSTIRFFFFPRAALSIGLRLRCGWRQQAPPHLVYTIYLTRLSLLHQCRKIAFSHESAPLTQIKQSLDDPDLQIVR